MRFFSFLLVLAACSLLATDEPGDQEALRKKEVEALQGIWAVARIELDGKALVEPEEGFPLIRIAGEKIVEIATKKERKTANVLLRLDPTQKPKAMDIKDHADTYKGIYALEKGELRVAFRWDQFKGMRPQGFDTSKDETLVVVILKKK